MNRDSLPAITMARANAALTTVFGPNPHVFFESQIKLHWTEAEDIVLREMWPGTSTTAEIGDILGRSSNSVISRAWYLGLPKRPFGHRPSTEADELLRLLWPTATPLSQIAIACGYSNATAVRYRAERLGLPKRIEGKIEPQINPTLPHVSFLDVFEATAAKLDARIATLAEEKARAGKAPRS